MSDLKCSWAMAVPPAREAVRAQYPETVAFHEAHGDDLTQCDAVQCECGNTPHGEGFDPTSDENPNFRCGRCGKVYTAAGKLVPQEPTS